jgi:hypothetical protein
MTDVLGISAFGLKDSISLSQMDCHEQGFYLADAVLPLNPLGDIRLNSEADEERTHSGLYWPPEARIWKGKPIRRAPISYAWKALVEAGDRSIRWKTGRGSFQVPRIIASHINSLVADRIPDYHGKQTVNSLPNNKDLQPVIAIPDNLDEFGQEALLRELKRQGLGNSILIWRPVAAALSWLDKAHETMPDPSPEDWLLTIYCGPDSMEFTSFSLCAEVHQGKRFFVPLREQPSFDSGPDGITWAAAVVRHLMGLQKDDICAFWRAFTKFPEIWAAIAQRLLDKRELPRPLNINEKWTNWNPPKNFLDAVWKIPIEEQSTLKDIFLGSCPGGLSVRRGKGLTWAQHLENELKRAISLRQKGKMLGLVIYGPLAPANSPPWLKKAIEILKNRGLQTSHLSSVAKPGSIWLASNGDDPVASGARIYGERIMRGEPTYLDTLPHLSILAVKNWAIDWVGIVGDSACMGGRPYKKSIKGEFLLEPGSDKLEVYLKKETRKVPNPDEITPNFGLPEQVQIEIREKVKSLGSLDAVISNHEWLNNSANRNYAIAYADLFYDVRVQERAPYRHGYISFPAKPEKRVTLDINVEMKPASGLAKVEIKPQDLNFLNGRSVFFDYSRMKDTHKLPKLKRGWPEIVEIEVINEASVFEEEYVKSNYRRFMAADVQSDNYEDAINGIQKAIWNSVLNDENAWMRKIDQNGNAGSKLGQKIVNDVAEKFASDFSVTIGNPDFKEIMQKIIIRGTWLWAKTPFSITECLENFFNKYTSRSYSMQWNYYTEAASRCFTKEEQFKLLCKAIHKRLDRPPANQKSFPIQSYRALSRILQYRKNSQFGLDDNMAYKFVDQAAEMIREQVRSRNFKQKFFQSILFFFVLLRYRKKNQHFMNPEKPKYEMLFKKVLKSLDDAVSICNRYDPQSASKVQTNLKEIKKYMYFKGVPGLIHKIRKEAGEDED